MRLCTLTRIVLPILAVLLFAQSAAAYTVLSPLRNWGSPPTYRVDNRGISSISDGSGGANYTVNAIKSNQAWNGAGCGSVVNAVKASISGFRLGDGIPMINFTDPTGSCTGSCLAATFTGYFWYYSYLFHYYITDADIVTNVTNHLWTSQGEDPGGVGCNGEFYIESVMVHEVGHGLGLGHSSVGSATMYPTTGSCNNGGASIATDDINGLKVTSPPPIVSSQCAANCETEWDYCCGYGACGYDPQDLQRCDVYLDDCLDTCMCN